MVRFIDKNLKSHYYRGEEQISDIISDETFNQLTELLTWHVRYLGDHSHLRLTHLLQKTTIQLGITKPNDFSPILAVKKTTLKDLFLTFEIILGSLYWIHPIDKSIFFDFVADFNEFFLIHGVPLQITYLPKKGEFYIGKTISEEVSEKIRETLEHVSEHEKTFQDFKKSIKEFSVGNNPESIKLCCKSIEDYLCLILGKNHCQNVEKYYKEVSKKLGIPDDLNEKFENLVKYIHKYRSIDSHGRIKDEEIEDMELVNESIIQFTMTLLIYLKKKKEKVDKNEK